MHSETNTPAKEDLEADISLTVERKSSFLEEDLALSTSTHDSTAERTITEPEEKTHDETTCSESEPQPTKPPAPIYVNEDAMDCSYNDESSNLSNVRQSEEEELQEDAPSPELFESDADDEAESTTSTFPNNVIDTESQPRVASTQSLPSPEKLSTEESVLRADKYLSRRINKFLRGVPPPPSHTILQKDCDDFLVYIKQNRRYFWADPFLLDGENVEADTSLLQTSTQERVIETNSANSSGTSTNSVNSTNSKVAKAGLRNLSTAFDACERSCFPKTDNNDSSIAEQDYSDTTSSFSLSDTLLNSSILSVSTLILNNEDSKLGDSINVHEKQPTLFSSIKIEAAINMAWPLVYKQRCPDLYFNRNKLCEEFESLRLKLCDRYIGAETQSTCNAWFVKQIPGSARKRSLLAKRNNGQSPGKRLSHLARRRRTFSSANLQGLGLVEKKQLYMNVRKGMIRKGKSPRGKSPRGKSPRGKTPRSSAKKRLLRRLTLDERSPRKIKPEIPKRALFQSPPTDRAGPSRVVTATVTSNNPQKVKRSLFPTPKKNEVSESSQKSTLGYPESRKRKSEEELEHSRHKFAKSLSFDCSRNLDSSQTNTWNPMRHSSSGLLTKEQSSHSHGKCELSETHRKKLLWAVAEALRSKGIQMSHPMFKQHATSLARTVRKYMPDLENKNIPRKPGSTSDRMLKLAKRHVIMMVESKTVT